MKRLLLGIAILLALLTPVGAEAQTTVGTRLGTSAAIILGDDVGDHDPRWGLVAGGFVDFGVSDLVAVEIGALYVQKGYRDRSDADVDLTFAMDYFEIPLLSVIRVGSGAVGARFYLGPTFGFQVGCEFAIKGGSTTTTRACAHPQFEGEIKTSSVDIGGLAGLGLVLDAGRVDLNIDAMFDLGLTSVLNDTGDQIPAKHRVFSFTTGLSLPVN